MKKLLTLAFAFMFAVALCSVSVAQEAASEAEVPAIEVVETDIVVPADQIEGYVDVCGPIMPDCCPRRPFLRRSCMPCMSQPACGCGCGQSAACGCAPCMTNARPQRRSLFAGRSFGCNCGFGAPSACGCGYAAPNGCGCGFAAPACGFATPTCGGYDVQGCGPCGYPGVRVGHTPVRNFFQRTFSPNYYYGTAGEMGYGYGY